MDEKELLATIANDVKWIKKELSQKADKWVETGAKLILVTAALYFLGVILDQFHFTPARVSLENIINMVI